MSFIPRGKVKLVLGKGTHFSMFACAIVQFYEQILNMFHKVSIKLKTYYLLDDDESFCCGVLLVMVDRHRHCVECGMPVPPEKDPPLCGKKCEYSYAGREKKTRKMRILMFMPLIVIMIVVIVLPILIPNLFRS
jgi:predicted nucleic acid-binding Zn ribbon protein